MADEQPPPQPPAEAPRPKTSREREDARREAKLEDIQRQVDSGSLNIRQMTDAERKRFGEPTPRPERGRKKRP